MSCPELVRLRQLLAEVPDTVVAYICRGQNEHGSIDRGEETKLRDLLDRIQKELATSKIDESSPPYDSKLAEFLAGASFGVIGCIGSDVYFEPIDALKNAPYYQRHIARCCDEDTALALVGALGELARRNKC